MNKEDLIVGNYYFYPEIKIVLRFQGPNTAPSLYNFYYLHDDQIRYISYVLNITFLNRMRPASNLEVLLSNFKE